LFSTLVPIRMVVVASAALTNADIGAIQLGEVIGQG
jgi:hypothetical protein